MDFLLITQKFTSMLGQVRVMEITLFSCNNWYAICEKFVGSCGENEFVQTLKLNYLFNLKTTDLIQVN